MLSSHHPRDSREPEISIVIATYDRPAALARCLESLLVQSSKRSFEIIVVDNHPQSGLTAPLVDRFPSVGWYRQPIRGLSLARNLGIEASTGAVLITTDDDVIAPQGWMERLTEPLFDPVQKPLAVTTGNCLPWKTETDAERLFESYGGLRHGDFAATFDARWMEQWHVCFPHLWRIGTTANAAFRASIFRDPAIGLFDPHLGAGSPAGAWEDLYSFYRILTAGLTIQYLPEAVLLHAHRETMPELEHQLCAYRRGETSFLTLVLVRHHEWRALGQMLLWIPYWRLSLVFGEVWRRLRRSRRFPLRLLLTESLAYFEGPFAIARGRVHETSSISPSSSGSNTPSHE
jgi:glycosyltransferase involved in cell wall biosynthesis